MCLNKAWLLCILSGWSALASAKVPGVEQQAVELKPANGDITIDGQLDEVAWQDASFADNFSQNFPSDQGPAIGQTTVKLTFDENYLYVGAICYTQEEGDYVVTSLRRDFDFPSNDNFNIYLDPFNDRTNGFMFGVSPWGVQREGLIANGNKVSTDWDNKWFVKVTRAKDHWVAEMAIPFRSIRYKPDNREWNLQFIRNDLKINERSTWAPVPQGYRTSSLAFAGKMFWSQNPPKPKGLFTIIPYAAGGGSQDFMSGYDPGKLNLNGNIGADAKIAVSSALNLDLTINPDFSQVEVDQQVTNLDRFELFFPERRQFFLENSDLFGDQGFTRIRPFYSRRIGLNAPVIAGARFSGKPNQNWRVGLLNVQTARVDEENTPANNFTVGTFQRQVWARSVISGIVVNKQATTPDTLGNKPYNRVVGIDFNLRSADDSWWGKVFLHKSFDSEVQGQDFAHALFFGYNSRNVFAAINYEMVGDNYRAATGFVPRSGYFRFEPFAQFSFFPKSKIVQRHGSRIRFDLFSDSPYKVDTILDRRFSIDYSVDFLNTSSISTQFSDVFTLLFSDFDPANSGNDTVQKLPAGTSYRYQRWSLGFNTDNRKVWSVNGSVDAGKYFNGTRLQVSGGFRARFQPYVNFAVNFNYNRIRLPEGFASVDYWLIAPRVDLTFTDELFWTTFIQYNAQSQNFGVNTRLQWRFAPVSDFFVVYTDNYLTQGQEWMPRTRGLIMKLTYWLNI